MKALFPYLYQHQKIHFLSKITSKKVLYFSNNQNSKTPISKTHQNNPFHIKKKKKKKKKKRERNLYIPCNVRKPWISEPTSWPSIVKTSKETFFPQNKRNLLFISFSQNLNLSILDLKPIKISAPLTLWLVSIQLHQ